MYCNHCGAFLPNGAKFCVHCGKPVLSMTGNVYFADKIKEKRIELLTLANDIAKHLVPKKLGAFFPTVKPITFVVACLAIFIVTVTTINILTGGGHDLSGTYLTYDFYPVNQITFDKKGNFYAVFCTSSYTETYKGKYRKERNGKYICRFTKGESTSGNPVLKFEASTIGDQYEFVVQKIDEYTLQAWIEAKISYWAWDGKSSYFYKY